MPDLIARLLESPEGFDLFQALHLLERAEPSRQAVGSSLGWDEAVRLSAHTSLGFAPSDIRSVGASNRPGPALTLSSAVMALGGAQGPLPLPFTEMLLERARGRDLAGMAFLDMFQQRLLGFLYRGRRKHRVPLTSGAMQASPPLRVLDALSGLGRGEGARGPRGQQAWLRHAGLQGAAPRSMASLLALLHDRLGIAFQGQSFVGAWYPLACEERARLAGRAGRMPPGRSALGAGLTLGGRAWNPGAGIALSTAPLRAGQVEPLLPGGATHGLLAWLVARHQQRDVQVHVQVAIAQAPPTRLCTRPLASLAGTGAGACLAPRLGLSAWLSGPAQSPRFQLRAQETTSHGH